TASSVLQQITVAVTPAKAFSSAGTAMILYTFLAVTLQGISQSCGSEPPYGPPPPYHRPEPYGPPSYEEPAKPYSFGYAVHDSYNGNDFSANEESNGKQVKGSYNVLLPDGRKQTVIYTAGPPEGYKAEVKYEGEAKHPHEPAYHPPSPY
ncbi:unnamed protein product, partial [Meganyctiphanes norvegica]